MADLRTPFKIVNAGIFLTQYVMEAVGFSEFIYEEAVQQGLTVLRSIEMKKDWKTMNYMRQKFLSEIYTPAYTFHKTFGPLNPYTDNAFECFYQQAWNKFVGIKHTV